MLIEEIKRKSSVEKQRIIKEIIDLLLSESEFVIKNPNRLVECPHCQSSRVVANGRLRGIQRYKCKQCLKNFSETTGMFHFSMKKKELLGKYLHCLVNGKSIRASAAETGISVQTSFHWRHKLLAALRSLSPQYFHRVLKLKPMVLKYSEKGKKKTDNPSVRLLNEDNPSPEKRKKAIVLLAADNLGNWDMRLVSHYNVSSEDIKKSLDDRIALTKYLCSYPDKKISRYSRIQRKILKKIKPGPPIKKTERAFALDTVIKMEMDFKLFMIKFRGVATKYLQNYLFWYLLAEKLKNHIAPMDYISSHILNECKVWFAYKSAKYNIYFRT